MRGIVFLMAVAGFIVTAGQGHAAEVSRRELAEQLMLATNARVNFENVVTVTKQNMALPVVRDTSGTKRIPGTTDYKTMATVSQEVSWDKVKERYVTLYLDSFGDDEMKALINFFNSPVGKTYNNKLSEMMKRSVELSQYSVLKALDAGNAMKYKLKKRSEYDNSVFN